MISQIVDAGNHAENSSNYREGLFIKKMQVNNGVNKNNRFVYYEIRVSLPLPSIVTQINQLCSNYTPIWCVLVPFPNITWKKLRRCQPPPISKFEVGIVSINCAVIFCAVPLHPAKETKRRSLEVSPHYEYHQQLCFNDASLCCNLLFSIVLIPSARYRCGFTELSLPISNFEVGTVSVNCAPIMYYFQNYFNCLYRYYLSIYLK